MSRKLLFAIAGPQDEAELRALLRSQPLPGWVSLGFEREPDYFAADSRHGVPQAEGQRVLLAREADSGVPAGFCARSVRRVYVDGEVQRLGYLGQFRTAPGWQRGHQAYRLLRLGFEQVSQQLRRDDELRYDITSILADNRPARRILGADLPGLPHYHWLGGFNTLVYRSGGRLQRGVAVLEGSRLGLAAIADCLQRHYRHYRYAPVWDVAAITAAGLSADDFLLLCDDQRVTACVALWDQRAYKQTVVRAYRPPLGLLRPLLNLSAPLTGLPALPPVGETLRQGWLALLACDPDHPAALQALLAAARVRARQQGLQSVMLGLADDHPLLPNARAAHRQLNYRSDIYTIHWSGEADLSGDTRPLHLELASL